MADPEATAKNIEALLGKIEARMASIASHTSNAANSAASFGSNMGGNTSGGSGASTGAAGGGRSGGGLGLASVPPPAGGTGGGRPTGTPPGGSGSGQNNLGLGRIAANAVGAAVFSAGSRYGNDKVGVATGADIMAGQFSMAQGNNQSAAQFQANKNGWLHGLGLANMGGYSSQDDRAAAGTLAGQYTPGGTGFTAANKVDSSIAMSGLQPGISRAQISGFRAQTAAPSTYNAMRMSGINGTDKYGNGLNADQLAAQFKSYLKPGQMNANTLRRLEMTGGSIQRDEAAWGFTDDQSQQFQNSLLAQVTGNTKNGSKIDTATRKLANAKDKTGLMTASGVVAGAADADNVAAFGESVKQFALASQAIANAAGYMTGFSQQSGSKGAGAVATLLHGSGHGVGRTLMGAAAGAATGAAIGSVVPGIGTGVGAVVGGVLGAFGGQTPGSASGASSMGSTGGASGPTGPQAPSKGATASAGTKSATVSLKHIWPVGAGGVTQPFNAPPNHHPGVDFGRPHGTPIHSAAAGVVLFAGPCTGFGSHFVVVYHTEENKVTRYGHGSNMFVKVGDKVQAGTVIAAVGTEGQSTGDHLHLELANGKAINGNAAANMDPIPWLGGAGTSSATATSTPTDSAAQNSSSGPTSGASGPTGFQSLTLDEGLTSSLLAGGGSSGASVSSSTATDGKGAAKSTAASSASTSAKVSGNWAKNLPKAGQQYASLIQGAAHTTGVNPALIAAVANTESGFSNPPGSGDGLSMGIMQFIQSTGATYGLKTTADRMDPGKNFVAGGEYLHKLLSASKGDVYSALEGYNSGQVGNPISAGYADKTMATFKSYGDGGGIGSYAKGAWEIDRDQAAIIHKGEMVVPSAAASVLRAGGGGGNGANVSIQVTLANASNSEAMRLVGIVKSSLAADAHSNVLANT